MDRSPDHILASQTRVAVLMTAPDTLTGASRLGKITYFQGVPLPPGRPVLGYLAHAAIRPGAP